MFYLIEQYCIYSITTQAIKMSDTLKIKITALWAGAGYEIVNTGSQCWAARKVVHGVLFSATDYAETDMPAPDGHLSVSAYDAETFEYLDAFWEVDNLTQLEQLIPIWLHEMGRGLPAAPAPFNLLELALQRALSAYAGKVDKGGQPYILHPIRVMAAFSDPVSQAIALLHEVIEDSSTTAEDLRAEGFPEVVVAGVLLLTRQAGEPYAEYIERVGSAALTRRIKQEDLRDNMDLKRLMQITPKDQERMAKYLKAWRRLEELAQAAR